MLRSLILDPSKTLSDAYAAYVAWSQANRFVVWCAAAMLVVLYVFIENWGQPWIDDDLPS